MIISSTQNDKVKRLVKLQDKRFRKEAELAVVEGDKFVKEAVAAGQVTEVYISENFKGSFKHPSLEAIALSDPVFRKVSKEITPQGILAVVKTDGLKCSYRPSGNFLVLDRIQDPSNMGAIIRSAAAANFKDVYLIDCVDVFNSKTIQASAGNIFKLKYRNISVGEIPAGENVMLVVADMEGVPIQTFKAKPNKLYGLVVGNEGKGVSGHVRAICSDVVKIEMDNGVESLNAAVAASIIMFKIKEETNVRS